MSTEYRLAEWEHYDDLPYEVVVETTDAETGKVTHRELVGRNSLLSEAHHRLSSARQSIVNPATHRARLEVVKRIGKAAES